MLRNKGGRTISLRHVLNQKKRQKLFLVPYFTTIEVVAPLENEPILSGRLIRSLDILNSKIHPLFQILDTDSGWCKNSGIVASKNSGGAAAAGGGGGVHMACRI